MSGFPAQSPVCILPTETEFLLNNTSPSSSTVSADSQLSCLQLREPKGAFEKSPKRHGFLAAASQEGTWRSPRGNNDSVKCHLLFPQSSVMVLFQQQTEGITSYKTIQQGGKAQVSGGLTSKMKSSLSQQDMHNTYVKGPQSISFTILLAETKFLDV